MSSLRVGLIGLGAMGRNHARVLAGLDGVEFVGICDPFVFNGEKYSHGRPIFKNLEELLTRKINYAVIAVPTQKHLETVRSLAAENIHILIEKPVSHDLNTSLEIKSLSKDICVGIGHIERYNPAISEAKNKLEMLGEIFQVITSRQGPYPVRINDVGVVYDLATHDIDATSWITGRRYKSVYGHSRKHLNGSHEDLVSVAASLDSDIVVNHSVNWLSPFKERQIILTGEKGAFRANMLTGELTFFRNGSNLNKWDEIAKLRGVSVGDVIQFSYDKKEPLLLEHENFRDKLLGKKSNIISLEDGVNTVIVADAILRSVKHSKVINL